MGTGWAQFCVFPCSVGLESAPSALPKAVNQSVRRGARPVCRASSRAPRHHHHFQQAVLEPAGRLDRTAQTTEDREASKRLGLARSLQQRPRAVLPTREPALSSREMWERANQLCLRADSQLDAGLVVPGSWDNPSGHEDPFNSGEHGGCQNPDIKKDWGASPKNVLILGGLWAKTAILGPTSCVEFK